MGSGLSHENWGSILDKHAVDEVATKRAVGWTLVRVPSTATIEQALAVLSERRILSAPVYDESFNTDLGFVDMLDIVAFAVDNLDWNEPSTFFLSSVQRAIGMKTSCALRTAAVAVVVVLVSETDSSLRVSLQTTRIAIRF